MRLMLVLLSAMVLAADAPLPEIRAEPLEDGSVLRVKNTGSDTLTAFVIEMVGYPGNHYLLVTDEFFRKLLKPGEEREYQIRSMMPGAAPEYLKVTAAVYLNGEKAGAREKLELIFKPRRAILAATSTILKRLGTGAELVSAGDDPDTRRIGEMVNGWLKQGRKKEEAEKDLREAEEWLKKGSQ